MTGFYIIFSIMKYTESLIKKFISLRDDVSNIADKLILKTCEIEEIFDRKIPDLVVIWKVLEVKNHPDADKLVVCQLDCWHKWKYQIVTGGENVIEWAFVPVALPGCYLPKIDLHIEKRKMRWLESDGMICSKDELGIPEDQDQHRIWILQNGDDWDFDDLSDLDLWISLAKKYPRLEWFVFDVDNKTLTNRPDLTWHFGIATELNSMYHDQKNLISYNKVLDYYKNFQHTNLIELLENAQKSSRKIISQTAWLRSYILLNIQNISVLKSTFFTRLQLLDLWLEPRSNWVDFSNLFLFLTGQPVHFFDADNVNGDIIVRNAFDWEKFEDLFWKEHSLLETDIVIADKEKILALAGVIWAKTSWVTENTKNVLVEIANFDPVMVRKTWTRLGLRTDAELRFEKDINPEFSLMAFIFFMDFIKDYSKDLWGFDFGGIDFFLSEKVKSTCGIHQEITLNPQKMENFIFGKSEDGFISKAKSYLEGIGFVVKEQKDIWLLEVPFWRSPKDVSIKEDVYEEVARLYGYENVVSIPIIWEMKNVEYKWFVDLQRKIEDFMVWNWKFDQMETYPWVDNKFLDMFGTDKNLLYSLQNPLNVEASLLRDCMLYNLLSYVVKNSRFFDEISIFDLWKVRNKRWEWVNKTDLKEIDNQNKHSSMIVGERMQIWALVYKKTLDNWFEDSFLVLKSLMKDLFAEIGVCLELEFVPLDRDYAHPKKQIKIFVKIGWEKKLLWFIISIHPLVSKELKIPENSSLSYLSLYLDVLWEATSVSKNKFSYETLQDQIVWRDLCFVLDNDRNFGNILSEVEKVKEVSDIDIFDIYEWENLWKSKKSISFKFKIKWDWNMTTEEINEIMNKVISVVEQVWWELRK